MTDHDEVLACDVWIFETNRAESPVIHFDRDLSDLSICFPFVKNAPLETLGRRAGEGLTGGCNVHVRRRELKLLRELGSLVDQVVGSRLPHPGTLFFWTTSILGVGIHSLDPRN